MGAAALAEAPEKSPGLSAVNSGIQGLHLRRWNFGRLGEALG